MTDANGGERPTADEAAPVWRTTHIALVLDARRVGEVRMLVWDGVAGAETEVWELPWWVVEGRRDHENLAPLAAEAREQLGLDVVVLRFLEPQEDAARRVAQAMVVLAAREPDDLASQVRESTSATSLPAGDDQARLRRASTVRESTSATSAAGLGALGARAGDELQTERLNSGRWVTRAELEKLKPREAAQWAFAKQTLDEVVSGAALAGRTPWARPGWFSGAAAWMVERLEAAGRVPTGSVEQFRAWCISSVLRAPTAGGYVYLKAASAHFGAEARITSALAEQFPAFVPHVLAVDLGRSWLLLDDVGEALRRPDVPVDVALWERALCQMGEMQRAGASQTDWLLGLGCADRRLSQLRAQVPALLEAPETRAETDPALLARLVARVPELQAACDALAGCGVPETLIHGDLHAGNVRYKEGKLRIFDWTDAAVGHPFFDLLTFLPSRPRVGIDDPAAVSRRLLDAYLDGWTALAPRGDLDRAAALAQTVGRLHHAQSYLQILRSVEAADYWQFRGDIARWLAPLDDTT